MSQFDTYAAIAQLEELLDVYDRSVARGPILQESARTSVSDLIDLIYAQVGDLYGFAAYVRACQVLGHDVPSVQV